MRWKVAGGGWQLLGAVVKSGDAQHLLMESKHLGGPEVQG